MSTQVENPVLLTADEVAALLRTSRAVVYQMARAYKLPGVIQLGRRKLFRRDRLLRFLAEREGSVPSLGGEA